MWRALAKYDTFARSKAHVQQRTIFGGILSTVSVILMVWLLISEFSYFRSTRVEEHLIVDRAPGRRIVEVSLEIDFFGVPCKDAELRLEDSKGAPLDDVHISVSHVPLDQHGIFAVTAGVNPDTAPGCKVVGVISMHGIAGNFHIAPGRGHGPGHMFGGGPFGFAFAPADFQSFNASHVIRRLAFGKSFPGQLAPLDGVEGHLPRLGSQFQYHLKVVPTTYVYLYGSTVDSHQFSATSFVHSPDLSAGLLIQPGIWFRFDFSPIALRLVETRNNILAFLTSVCAILGGVFACAGVIDTIAHRMTESNKIK
jgi:Endoplasmic reticulum vesicle transporter/Endoplasmic Reticulum-Golgi Intermediate Compartment (ERGIC)